MSSKYAAHVPERVMVMMIVAVNVTFSVRLTVTGCSGFGIQA